MEPFSDEEKTNFIWRYHSDPEFKREVDEKVKAKFPELAGMMDRKGGIPVEKFKEYFGMSDEDIRYSRFINEFTKRITQIREEVKAGKRKPPRGFTMTDEEWNEVLHLITGMQGGDIESARIFKEKFGYDLEGEVNK